MAFVRFSTDSSSATRRGAKVACELRDCPDLVDPRCRRAATNNYEVLKRMAKSVEYEYILNMNYTVVTF